MIVQTIVLVLASLSMEVMAWSKLTLHFSAEADMVDWARGHCFAQWTGGLGP